MTTEERLRSERITFEAHATLGHLSDEDVARVRALGEDESKRGHYAHDLSAAVRRGYHNQARMRIADAIHAIEKAGYGNMNPRVKVGLTLSCLVDEAASLGLTADDIRTVIDRMLKRTDSLSIERRVERRR